MRINERRYLQFESQPGQVAAIVVCGGLSRNKCCYERSDKEAYNSALLRGFHQQDTVISFLITYLCSAARAGRKLNDASQFAIRANLSN
jgi:uncharacterized SAM-binding protein YcdF (DUF218 family)